jgi:hypothetical protein
LKANSKNTLLTLNFAPEQLEELNECLNP